MVHQLVEVNAVRLREPLDSPSMNGLVRALDDVNWLAEHSSGFVWRLRLVDGAPLVFGRSDGHEGLVTLAVWESFESLQRSVYRTAYGLLMQRRRRWFEPIGGFSLALWWVVKGNDLPRRRGVSRLDSSPARHGPTRRAFSLRRQFEADRRSHLSAFGPNVLDSSGTPAKQTGSE